MLNSEDTTQTPLENVNLYIGLYADTVFDERYRWRWIDGDTWYDPLPKLIVCLFYASDT